MSNVTVDEVNSNASCLADKVQKIEEKLDRLIDLVQRIDKRVDGPSTTHVYYDSDNSSSRWQREHY
jgi:hypothetical protein